MRNLLVIPALLVSLAACGAEEVDPAAKPAPTDAATSSAPVVAKVSDATICSRLIDAKHPPMERAIDVMAKDYEVGDEDVALEVADELEELGGRAESDVFSTHLQVMADELRAIFGGGKEDTADFVASATEVNQVCGNTARF